MQKNITNKKQFHKQPTIRMIQTSNKTIIPTPIEVDTPQISDQIQNQRLQPKIETNTAITQQTTIVPPTPAPILQQRNTEVEIQMSSAVVSDFCNNIPTTILEEGEITDTDSQMSSSVIPKQCYTTRNTRTDKEINEASRFCVELHKNSFCDIGRLDKLPPSKRRKIVAKAMLLELGPYDPSDEFVMNYKDKLTVDIYRRLAQLNLDKNNLYKQIYQQLTYC